jgi:cytoskeletal protein RodZ
MVRVGKLDPTQVEQLKEIGTYLQQLREEQGRSLDEIAAQTFIPLRLLRAIEAGNAEVLPEAVFIQGFIRRFADALHLDGIAVARHFSLYPVTEPDPEDVAIASSRVTQPEIIPIRPDPSEPSTLERPPMADLSAELPPPIHTPSLRNRGVESSNPAIAKYVIALLGLVVVGGGIYGMTQLLPQDRGEAPVAEETTPSPVEPSAEVSVVPTASPSPTPETPAAPVTVQLSLTDASWMRVTVDGEADFEGTLPKGTERTWTAQDEIEIVVGNAGAVMLSLNGGDASKMGDPGQVEDFSFQPDSVFPTPTASASPSPTPAASAPSPAAPPSPSASP